MVDPTGVAGLFSLLGTCLELLNLGFIASDRKEDVRILSIQLSIEEFLLGRWAVNVGILQGHLQPERQLRIPKATFQHVEEALQCMLMLFDQSRGMVERCDGTPALTPLRPPNLEQSRPATEILRRMHTVVRSTSRNIRWAVRDAKRLGKLVDEVSTLRDRLMQLLPEDLAVLERQLIIDTVTPLPSREVAQATLQALSRVAAREDSAAKVADGVSACVRIKTNLPVWKVLTEVDLDRKRLCLLNPDFNGQRLPPNLARWMTLLKTNSNDEPDPVLVEWRLEEQPGAIAEREGVSLEDDVLQLANLLSVVAGNPKFHTLDCMGYFRDDTFSSGPRFGFVFRTPKLAQEKETLMMTLADAIKQRKRPPELGLRFYLATHLTKALYYFLSTGWLHKGIRSHNIVLFEPRSTSDIPLVEKPTVCILGFEFSRPDLPGQRSLNAKDNEAVDLYRHPDSTSDKWDTESYRQHGYQKVYDIYSLGVVLMEIGVWRAVQDIKISYDKKRKTGVVSPHENFPTYLKHKASLELPEHMGRIYTDIVVKCLSDGFAGDRTDPHGAELLAKFDTEGLEELSRCRV